MDSHGLFAYIPASNAPISFFLNNNVNNFSLISVGLVQNAALLLASAFLFDVFASRWRTESSFLFQKIAVGFVLGVIGMVVMLTPWKLMPGVVFDTRSVLIGITGLFFGIVPTAVAMLMTATLRLSQGGAGVWMGVAVILASGVIGLLWRHAKKRRLETVSWRELLVFGLVIHVVMLAKTILLPREIALDVLTTIALPVILIYPLGTALLGSLMVRRLSRERTEENLLESEFRYRTLADSGQALIWASGLDGKCNYFNKTWLDFTGRTLEQELGDGWLEGVHPDDRDRCVRTYRTAFARRERFSMEYRLRHAGGEYRWLQDDGTPRFDRQGNFLGYIGHCLDITMRKQAEVQLRNSRDELRRLTRIIDESINIIFITTADGTIEYVNSRFEEITGWPRQEAVGQNPRILASGETTREQYAPLWKAISSGETWRGVFKNKTKHGGFYWANGFISPIRNEDGEITHFMAIQEDITDKVASKKEMRFLAEHDRITGLINRVRFVELLGEALSGGKGHGTASLLQIDIDGFKLINDAFGNAVGDQFLGEFARFLMDKVQAADPSPEGGEGSPVVGRLGGDEFGVFVPGMSSAAALDIAESIRLEVENSIFLGGTVRVTVSIGLVEIPKHGTTSAELLAKSNAATVAAKESGQNRCSVYQQGDRYLHEVHSSLETKQMIIKALDEDRIVPWFQPILHLRTGLVEHYEALARLEDADGRTLSPASFIPTAERFGLIYRIDHVIIQKTVLAQARLRQEGRNLSFSMNISGKNLGDKELLSRIQGFIRDSGADPACIVFELTETAAVRNLKEAVTFVKALKEWGCKFSLDDFGVGFTSFMHLVEMEVDFLKIDGSFVRRLPDSARDRILVKTITDMARGLGIKTIAEFVDHPDTIRILKQIGVDYAQGYLVGKPSPTLLEAGEAAEQRKAEEGVR